MRPAPASVRRARVPVAVRLRPQRQSRLYRSAELIGHRQEERDHDESISARTPASTRRNSAERRSYEAAVLRFRPIMMTTMAAIFGIMPIAIGFGAGR